MTRHGWARLSEARQGIPLILWVGGLLGEEGRDATGLGAARHGGAKRGKETLSISIMDRTPSLRQVVAEHGWAWLVLVRRGKEYCSSVNLVSRLLGMAGLVMTRLGGAWYVWSRLG